MSLEKLERMLVKEGKGNCFVTFGGTTSVRVWEYQQS